jgi:hypothetical protein
METRASSFRYVLIIIDREKDTRVFAGIWMDGC